MTYYTCSVDNGGELFHSHKCKIAVYSFIGSNLYTILWIVNYQLNIPNYNCGTQINAFINMFSI